MIETFCKLCCKKFYAQAKELNRGNAKFCSKSCSTKNYFSSKTIIPNCTCTICKIQFYRSKSKQSISRSGLQFCSRKCKEYAQSLKGNIKEIQPKHYGTGKADYCKHYRKIAFDYYPHKCDLCGYCKIVDILEVHHKNHNRLDDSIENLQILCSRCHDEHHYLTKSGKWKDS